MGSGAMNANNLHFLDEFSIVDELLGKGGSGKVMQGIHLASNTPVAIKMIDPLERSNAERARKLFEREVKLHSIVSDLRGVVRLIGASPPSSKDRCYLATELATMGDLFVLLNKRRALSERKVRRIILQLVVAVAGLHRNNICHRDIKPENLLLERSQLNPRQLEVMVADFGHAGLLSAGNTLLYTRDCGTPGYQAPELSGDWKHGHGLAADLWSVGAVMNDCFSFKPRQPSFDDGTFWTRDIWDSVSTNARDLLGRLLEPDPGKRITADEALRHPWLAGGTTEPVSRGISASGSTKSVAGKGTTLNLLQELCNTSNAPNITIDGVEGTTKNESRRPKTKRIENAGPFQVTKSITKSTTKSVTEKKGGRLGHPQSSGTTTSDDDSHSSGEAGGNESAAGKTTKNEVLEGSPGATTWVPARQPRTRFLKEAPRKVQRHSSQR